MIFDFQSLALPMLVGLLAICAAAVWWGGTRLAKLVDALTTKTGAGQALMGMLLLGGITSLPEVAAVSTSAAIGNAPLAINNLLGTASINVLLLAVADLAYGRGALTGMAARPVTLIQGVLAMILAAMVAMVATIGDFSLFGIGVGSAAIAASALTAIWISSNFASRHVWEAVNAELEEEGSDDPGDESDRPLASLILSIALCGLLILAAGFIVSSSADAIATKTGLAAGIVGFLLIGLVTSLPEISTILGAVKLGRYQMAIGDIFGTNLFNMMLIFLADIFYRGGPVLSEAGRFEQFGAILTILMTGIFVVGLLERRDRSLFRMGYDSLASILAFALGVWLLATTMT